MMVYVDYLLQLFVPLTGQYVQIATILAHYDRLNFSRAYVGGLSSMINGEKVPAGAGSLSFGMPDLTKIIINYARKTVGTYQYSQTTSPVPQLSSVPIMMYTTC